MIALIGLGYVSADQPTLAIVLLILSVGLNGAMYVGFMVSLEGTFVLFHVKMFLKLFSCLSAVESHGPVSGVRRHSDGHHEYDLEYHVLPRANVCGSGGQGHGKTFLYLDEGGWPLLLNRCLNFSLIRCFGGQCSLSLLDSTWWATQCLYSSEVAIYSLGIIPIIAMKRTSRK